MKILILGKLENVDYEDVRRLFNKNFHNVKKDDITILYGNNYGLTALGKIFGTGTYKLERSLVEGVYSPKMTRQYKNEIAKKADAALVFLDGCGLLTEFYLICKANNVKTHAYKLQYTLQPQFERAGFPYYAENPTEELPFGCW